MYHDIAVPLDGSKFAERALPLALRLSQRAGAALHLLAVAEPDGEPAAKLEEYLAKTAERLREDHTGDVSTGVRAGRAVDRLLEEVEERGADITVMATHGRGGLKRMWLGSVAMGFLHRTDKPLLLVRPEEGERATHWGFAKLLVPLDGTELSERVLAHATGFGSLFDAAYHLVRVVIPPVDPSSPYVPAAVDITGARVEETTAGAQAYLDGLAEPMRARGLHVTTSVAVDSAAGRGIVRVAEEEGCDSVAMASHGRVGLDRAILGSAAEDVLRGAHVPLLLYRPHANFD